MSICVNIVFIAPLCWVFQALEVSSKQDKHGLAVMGLTSFLGSQTISTSTSKHKERISRRGYVF